MKRSTKAVLSKRVEEILQMRLAGASFLELRQYASVNDWNISERQLWRYVAESDALLQKAVEKNIDKLLALHLAQRRLILNRTMENGDYRTALAVLRDSAELQGLYPPKDVNLNQTTAHAVIQVIEKVVDAEDLARGREQQQTNGNHDPANGRISESNFGYGN